MLAPILESLKQPLDHCLSAFCELQQKINKYTKRSGDAKQSKRTTFWWDTKKLSIWWEFTERDTAMYQSHLASYKSTIDIALTTATL
jgi:hypothetical protein